MFETAESEVGAFGFGEVRKGEGEISEGGVAAFGDEAIEGASPLGSGGFDLSIGGSLELGFEASDHEVGEPIFQLLSTGRH